MIVASGITMCALSKPRNNETYYDDRNFDVIGPSNENRYIYIYIHTNSRGFSVTLCFSFLYDITDKTGIDKIDTRFAIIIATRIRFNFKPNYTILLTPSCLFIFVLSSIDNLWDWQTFEKNYFTRIFVNDQQDTHDIQSFVTSIEFSTNDIKFTPVQGNPDNFIIKLSSNDVNSARFHD